MQPGDAQETTTMRMTAPFATAAIISMGALAWPAGPVKAEHFCGFRDQKGSVVQCGYSTLSQCQKSVGGKNAICRPDPAFASRKRQRAAG